MTKKWKLHTVDGTGDILPEQCAVKYEVEARIMETFARFGYRTVETPVLQFYDAFDSSNIPEETMFKFFDKEGRIVVMRPDITTPLARIAAAKLTGEAETPIRLCYSGKVFRHSSKHHEFTQAGVELYGVTGARADAEVVACGIEALLAAGLSDFQIELGQSEFFRGLVEQCGFTAEQAEQLRGYIDKKDSLAVSVWLREFNLDEPLRKLLCDLPIYFGGAEVLERVDTAILGERSRRALRHLKKAYDILESYGFANYVSIDLSMVGGLDYYTGVIFKGFTHGLGFAICGGGRYDSLAEGFGKAVPAVGLAIDTDNLLLAMERQHITVETAGVDVFVHGSGNHTLDYNILSALRAQGISAEYDLSDGGLPEAIECAKRRGIGGVADIGADGSVSMHNIATGEVSKLQL